MKATNKPEPEDFGLTHEDLSRIEREERHSSDATSPFDFISYPWLWIIPLPLLGKPDGIPVAIVLFIIWLIYILIFQDDLNRKHRDQVRENIIGLSASKDYKLALHHQHQALEKLERKRIVKEREEKRRNYDYWSNLDPYEFEKEVAVLFEMHGFQANVTKGSGDGGIDVLLRRNKKRYIVQCKRYATTVGPAAVRDLYGTMVSGKFDGGFLVCPSGFSQKAFEFASNKRIQFIGLKRIMELVHAENKRDLKFLF